MGTLARQKNARQKNTRQKNTRQKNAQLEREKKKLRIAKQFLRLKLLLLNFVLLQSEENDFRVIPALIGALIEKLTTVLPPTYQIKVWSVGTRFERKTS